MRRSGLTLIAVVLSFVLAAAAQAELPRGTEVVAGEAEGALYEISVPANWNGDLVLYSHGYVAPLDPLSIPSWSIRDDLLELGYAVAMSSYSHNGWAVREGFFETRHLLPLFSDMFAVPSQVLLAGHSMGGQVVLRLAEKHPGLFAGALPMCGVVGGAQEEFDFIYHTRVVFDHLFPGLIPGTAMEVPPALMLDGLDTFLYLFFNVLPVMCPVDWPACDDPDPRVLELAGVDQIEIPWNEPWEAAHSILLPLWGQLTSTPDNFVRTNDKEFFDNAYVTYSGSSDDDALNAGVARHSADPAGLAYLRRWYEPSGKLRIPILTLHTTRDGLVLIAQTATLAQKATEAGYSDNLVQRSIDRWDHCSFTADEELEAFLDLVEWVETGVKPLP